jgi:hypothetical protein
MKKINKTEIEKVGMRLRVLPMLSKLPPTEKKVKRTRG